MHFLFSVKNNGVNQLICGGIIPEFVFHIINDQKFVDSNFVIGEQFSKIFDTNIIVKCPI